MRQIEQRTLWVGNAGDLRPPREIFAAGIEAVVEVADSEPFYPLPRELIRCRFPLSDGGDNPTWLLQLAAESVATLIRSGVPVLVCCSAGLSRSVCVAAAGISIAEGLELSTSISIVVADGPADVSPGLLTEFLRALGSRRQ